MNEDVGAGVGVDVTGAARHGQQGNGQARAQRSHCMLQLNALFAAFDGHIYSSVWQYDAGMWAPRALVRIYRIFHACMHNCKDPDATPGSVPQLLHCAARPS